MKPLLTLLLLSPAVARQGEGEGGGAELSIYRKAPHGGGGVRVYYQGVMATAFRCDLIIVYRSPSTVTSAEFKGATDKPDPQGLRRAIVQPPSSVRV